MHFGETGIIGQHTSLAEVFRTLEKVAPTDSTVLVTGESGTGKELLVRALHRHSMRMDKPFVPINCGAIPKELLESELFGHEKGAFTHAIRARPGRFEIAEGGTVFLDEIGEMDPLLQVKILRVLQEREIERVGGVGVKKVDVRIIAATNRNLEDEVAAGRFREDLFYRIHVLALEIPPLRERREDIAIIAEYHCRSLCRTYGHPFGGFSAEALRVMEDYDWPGNVRQLVHSVEFAVNMAQGNCILPAHLPMHLQSAGVRDVGGRQSGGEAVAALSGMTDFNLDKQEAMVIRCALKHYSGNMLQAAKALGIGRNTLYAKLRKIVPQG